MIDIKIEKVTITAHPRKVGSLRKNGRGGSARRTKRSFVFMTWRYKRFADFSFIVYPEYK